MWSKTDFGYEVGRKTRYLKLLIAEHKVDIFMWLVRYSSSIGFCYWWRFACVLAIFVLWRCTDFVLPTLPESASS